MTVTTDTRPAAWELTPHRASAIEPTARPWEYVAVRATGVLLSVLVLGHFAVTHLVTDVAHDNASFVVRRLSSTLWIAWDSTMLAAVLAHGALGVRAAFMDYSTSRRRRRAVSRALGAVVLVVFVIGVAAIARTAHA
jgi:succinate dehydrogenase / fumarate reductase membrane anchor subunit